MITFEDARRIAASSPEVARWFTPGGVEITPWGWENSCDYILSGRTPGQPWWHEQLPDAPIPGPAMIVVSKAAGAVRTYVGAEVPAYYSEIGGEEETPIGDTPD
jgi:hypothetical protein